MREKEKKPGLLGVSIPGEYRAGFEEARLATNISRMYALSVYIVAIQILLNILNILKPGDTDPGNVGVYIALSLGALAVGAVYWVLFHLARRGKIAGQAAQRILCESLLYIYLGIQMTFATLNVISTGGVNSYIIAILIVGLFPILHPLQSVATILAAFGYLLGAMYLMRNRAGAWNAILVTDTWANLIIITGLTVCISVFMYQLYVRSFLKDAQLRRVNDGLEETVRRRTAELETQTRAAQVASEAKSHFLTRMSHEIRTPLNAIVGMTRIALKSADNPKATRSLGEIRLASDHLMDIIDDVLDMAKIESGRLTLEMAPFRLDQALEEVRNIITVRCLEKAIEFDYNAAGLAVVFVLGDKTRLKQVLINLLGNAVKFTAPGGRVSLQSAFKTGYDRVTVSFSVSDTGIGISQDRVSHLFAPFEQAEPHISAEYGGTGLGLTISQNLVNQMGGTITVDSSPGKGSTFAFTVSFPVAQSAAEPPAASGAVPLLTGKRILIVEDIEINRVILSELIADTGVAVEEAPDGRAAVEAVAASETGWYDLIFMDLQMPRMDGYEATRAIRALDRADTVTVPIIAMTANAYQEDVARCLEAGMNGHLAKPIDVEAVLAVLEERLASRVQP